MSEENPHGPEADAEVALCKKAMNQLGEHFDTVQIFATRYESDKDGGTVNIQIGTGNWFARYGHIRLWVEKSDEHSREKMRREFEE